MAGEDDEVTERDEDLERDDDGSAEIEKTARRMGWRPESEWDDSRGGRKPAKFLSPQEYVDKVENDIPVLRERLRHQDGQIAKLDGTVESISTELKESKKLIETLVDQNRQVGKRAYDKAKRELAAEKLAAVSAADQDAFRDVEAREKELEETYQEPEEDEDEPARTTERDPPRRTEAPAVDKVTAAWIEENEWFTKDPVRNAYARSVNDEIWADAKKNGDDLSKMDALIETKKRVVEKFPERFGLNPRRKARGTVSENRGDPPRRQRGEEGRQWDDLPQDARDTYARLKVQFKNRGEEYTQAQYLEDYQW